MKEFEYFIEGGNGIPEIIEFPDEMVEIAEKMMNAFPDVSLNDVNFRNYPGAEILRCDNDKKSLKFNVPLAKTRLERDMGEDLYIVTITKYL